MKKSSRFIDETQIEIGDNRTVLYGTYHNIVRVTVRGMFEPSISMNKKEYTEHAGNMAHWLRKEIEKFIFELDSVENRTIVETDVTEKVLNPNKPSKMRYTFFIKPVDVFCDSGELVSGIVRELSPVVDKVLDDHGFRRIDIEEPNLRHQKAKKL